MKVWLIFTAALLFTWYWTDLDKVYFQSEALVGKQLEMLPGEATILDDDGEPAFIDLLVDSQGMFYWRRKLHTPVCLTGECKEIDVGIYWYCTGEFMGLEVYQAPLTRTDHHDFTEEDYQQLISVLQDDWSILREYDYQDLIHEPVDEVDAVTGATRKDIAEATVQGAVYTTFTLWHLVNEGEKDQLRSLTATRLNQDTTLLNHLAIHQEKHYAYLLLDLFREGKLQGSKTIKALIINGIRDSLDHSFRKLAFQALNKVDFEDPAFQLQMAEVYVHLSFREKTSVLNAMKEGIELEQKLYSALIRGLSPDNEWFVVKTLRIIKTYPHPAPQVLPLAQELLNSKNTFVTKMAQDYINLQTSNRSHE